MEDKITGMSEEIVAKQHVLFSGLNSELAIKARSTACECVAAVLNEMRQEVEDVAESKEK